MAYHLHFNDLNSFDHKPIPAPVAAFKSWRSDTFLQLNHPKAGTIGMDAFALPHLQIMQLSWQTGMTPIKVFGHEKPARSIGVSFHLSGSMDTRFGGIQTPLQMRSGSHNLVFTPELDNEEHVMPGQDFVSALQMNLDENFFKSCIGSNTAWSEKMLTNLDKQTPFSGVANAAQMTPAMKQIIQSMQQLPQATPMRNLLIQSRALELLGLQFEQFAQTNLVDDVAVDDAEKLYRMKAYLDIHFLEDLSLTGLSRRFCLNEFKVKRGFKSLFKDTVFGYIRRLRMEYAVRVLRNSNISIDEVAYELGYEHAQHFSTAFRKFFGDSPSGYIHRRTVI